MKIAMIAAAIAGACFISLSPVAQAATTPTQDCRAEAGKLKGEARKIFMKDCVSQKRADKKASRKPPSEKQLAQRAKMKDCSAKFKDSGKAKSERRAFMSACMKTA
jgi:hypothetical protein